MSAMAWLKNSQVGSHIPNMHEVQGRRLSMEYVQGIRLYDMFRLLRNLSNKKPTFAGAAESAAFILMQRSVKRLGHIQQALSSWPLAPSLQAYPIDTHVGQLLSALLHLMQQPSLTEVGYRELKDFLRNGLSVMLSFRFVMPHLKIFLLRFLISRLACIEPMKKDFSRFKCG